MNIPQDIPDIGDGGGDIGLRTLRAARIDELLSREGMNDINTLEKAREKLIELYPELGVHFREEIKEQERDIIETILISFFDEFSGVPYFLMHERARVSEIIQICQTDEYALQFEHANPGVLQSSDTKIKRLTLLLSMGLHSLVGDSLLT